MAGLIDIGIGRRKQQRLQDQLLGLLGPQETAGPVQPGALPPQMEGLLPQNLAMTLSGLISNPMTQQVGLNVLQSQFAQPEVQKETSLVQNLRAAGFQPGTQEFQNKLLEILQKPQIQINQGDKLLGEKARNWINAQGQKASPTDTILTATQKGFFPKTVEEQKSAQAGAAAGPVIAQLSETAFGKAGEKSLFPSEKKSTIERAVSGASAKLEETAQSDERIVLYGGLKEAFVSQLARLAGQVGTLTDRDVDTVRGLFPIAGFTPEPIAKAQFKQIATLLLSKGIAKDALIGMGVPEWAFEKTTTPALPPGFVIE